MNQGPKSSAEAIGTTARTTSIDPSLGTGLLETNSAIPGVSWRPEELIWLHSAQDAIKLVHSKTPNAQLFRFFGDQSQDGTNCSAQFYDWTQPDDLFTVQLPVNKSTMITKQANDQIFPQHYQLLLFDLLDVRETEAGPFRTVANATALANDFLRQQNITSSVDDWESRSRERLLFDDPDYVDGFMIFSFSTKRHTPRGNTPAEVWVTACELRSDWGWIAPTDPDAERKWEREQWQTRKEADDMFLHDHPDMRYLLFTVVPKDVYPEAPEGNMYAMFTNGTDEIYSGLDGDEPWGSDLPSRFRVTNFTSSHITYSTINRTLVSPDSDMMNFTTAYRHVVRWQAIPGNSIGHAMKVFYEAYLLVTPGQRLKTVLAPNMKDHIYFQFYFEAPGFSPKAGSLFVESRTGAVYYVPILESNPRARLPPTS